MTIRYNRSLYVDFTLPYPESGIAMVVPVKESINKNAWIFLKPLTPDMWFGTIMLFYLHVDCDMVIGATRQQRCSWSNSAAAGYNDIFFIV